MNSKVVLVRSCCWLGALLDARAALNLTLLRFHQFPAAIQAHPADRALGVTALWSAGDACALMWGWTAILVWASFKPVERRAVLLLTVFPVVALLEVERLHLALAGFQPFSQVSSWFYFLIALSALFIFSFFYGALSIPQPAPE